MEMLIAVAIVTAVIGRGIGLTASDLKYAAKGKDHPRWAYKQAKLEAARRGEPTGYWSLLAARAWRKTFDKHADAVARQAARPAIERGPRPLRDYMGRCWADAWKTQERKHDKRVEARRRKRGEAVDEDGQPDPVEAPTDADLIPAAVASDQDGVDDAFDSAPREHPSTETGDPVSAPVDRAPVPSGAVYTASVDPALARIQALANQERQLTRRHARERARAYLYGEGPFDRKPSDEDLRVLENGNEADRAMAAELRKPDPELDRQWDENVQRQEKEILGRFAAEQSQQWSPFGEPEATDAKAPEQREPTMAEREELKAARHRAQVYFGSDDHTNLDRKPNLRDLGVLTAWGATEQDRAWAERIHAEFEADVEGAPRPDSDDREETSPQPAGPGAATTEHDTPDNVIPFNKPLPTPKGITSMSNLNTEIDGLESAIAWAQDVRNNAADMASGIDEVESDFATRGVKGETLTLVGQVGEAYEELRDLAAQLAEKLNAMTSVTEAYEAAPDAGDKEFVTS